MFRFIKKSNPLKANFLQKNPLAGMGETKKAARLESCLDDEIVNVFNDGKEIDD